LVRNVKEFKTKNVRESFYYALCGLADALRSERNMRLHIAATVIVLMLGFWFTLERLEWLFVFSAIFLVMTMEMLNTALERVVDLFTRQYHPLAKLAKNAAAGAALLAAVYAIIVGLLIFLPKFLAKFP